MAALRERQCGVSEERGENKSNDDFSWCCDFNCRRCSGDEGCLTTVTFSIFFFFFFLFLLFFKFCFFFNLDY